MYLARRDASGWAVFDEADGVPSHDPRYRRSGDEKVLMRAGADGTVWLTTFDMAGCARLVSYARGRTAEYLPDGACVHDLELDADGRAWVSVEHRTWSQAGRSGVDLYLVDPAR
jgi:streptogramin lyase